MRVFHTLNGCTFLRIRLETLIDDEGFLIVVVVRRRLALVVC